MHQLRDLMVLLVPPLVIFAVCSAKNGFSEHFRYVLPCFPFAFVWVSGLASTLGLSSACEQERGFHVQQHTKLPQRRFGFVPLVVSFMLMWGAASSCWIYPHSLSYFNEAIGGPLNGSKYLLGQ